VRLALLAADLDGPDLAAFGAEDLTQAVFVGGPLHLLSEDAVLLDEILDGPLLLAVDPA